MQRVQQKSFKMQIKRKLRVQLEWSAIAVGGCGPVGVALLTQQKIQRPHAHSPPTAHG